MKHVSFWCGESGINRITGKLKLLNNYFRLLFLCFLYLTLQWINLRNQRRKVINLSQETRFLLTWLFTYHLVLPLFCCCRCLLALASGTTGSHITRKVKGMCSFANCVLNSLYLSLVKGFHKCRPIKACIWKSSLMKESSLLIAIVKRASYIRKL